MKTLYLSTHKIQWSNNEWQLSTPWIEVQKSNH